LIVKSILYFHICHNAKEEYMQELEKQIDKVEEVIEVKYGNTTFQITSEYTGNVTLEHLIKRLIQREIENPHFYL